MSDWINYVRSVQEELGITYGEAMREASIRRRKEGYVTQARKTRRKKKKPAGDDFTDINPAGQGPMWDAVKRHALGFFDAVRGNRRNIKPTSRAVLDETDRGGIKAGDNIITELAVARTPLKSALNSIIKGVSKLRLGANDSDTFPSQLFHLFFIVKTKTTQGNIVTYKMEKNQDVSITQVNSTDGVTEMMNIPIKYNTLTMRKMLETSIKVNGSRFYNYSATDDNCQRWVYDMLAANGFAISDNLREFILQPAEKLVPYWAKKLGYVATSLANRSDLIIHGRGNNEFNIII
jgi:hypothetical protein